MVDMGRCDPDTMEEFDKVGALGMGYYLHAFSDAECGFGYISKPFGVLKSQIEMAKIVFGKDWQDNPEIDLEKDVKLIHFMGKEVFLFASTNRVINNAVMCFRDDRHHRFNKRALNHGRSKYHWYMLNNYFHTNTIVEDIYLEGETMNIKQHIGLEDRIEVEVEEAVIVEEVTEAPVEQIIQQPIHVSSQVIDAQTAKEAYNRHLITERILNRDYVASDKTILIEYIRNEAVMIRNEGDNIFLPEFIELLNRGNVSVEEIVLAIRNAVYGKVRISNDLMEWLDGYLGRRVIEYMSNSFGLLNIDSETLEDYYVNEHTELLNYIATLIPAAYMDDWVNKHQYSFTNRCFKPATVERHSVHVSSLLNSIDTVVKGHDGGYSIQLPDGDWKPITTKNFLVLEEKVLLAKVPYRLDELNLTTTTEVSSGSPRRICGQDNYISQLMGSIELKDDTHYQALTRDGYVLDVYTSPNDPTLVNYVLADAR